MSIRRIRLLGDPILRKKCSRVGRVSGPRVRRTIRDLRDTLADFRKRMGFGRGIAAPQIGIARRIIYLEFGYHGAMIDPVITRRSTSTFSLLDDCFSFPDLLVRLKRHTSIDVSFTDADGVRQRLVARGPLSELIQHEVDHVNGILAVDRAASPRDLVLRGSLSRAKQRKR
jgi:peptide deformylase